MELASLGSFALVGLIGVALLFDFMNGLHDAANSIATVVSTRVLRAAAPPSSGRRSSTSSRSRCSACTSRNTIGTGIVDAGIIDAHVIFGALTGAIVWNVITWGLGLPSSSSHALIGGLAGAGIAKAGIGAVVFGGLGKTAAGIVLSPLLGFVLAQLLVVIVAWLNLRSTPFAVDRRFRVLQLVVGVAVFARSRRQRRAEDDGHHRRAALFAGDARRRIPRAVLGRPQLPGWRWRSAR